MKQAVITSPHHSAVETAEIPTIRPHQLLLNVEYIGICGSDIQIYNGKHKYASYPVIPGHEVSGVVEKVGSEVIGFSKGNKVACLPQINCGSCYPCNIGRFNVCEDLKVMGVHEDGFAREYVVVNANKACLCPDNMEPDLITLVEPLAVGVGSVKRGNYKEANIVVIGAGTIGNFIAQSALALGNKNVLITDIADAKLEIARQCGIPNAINTKEISLSQSIEDTFGSRKADIIIDAAATSFSFDSALKAARPSSEIIITGNYKEPIELEVPLMQRREVNLVGHMMYVKEDFEDAINFLNTGKVNGKLLITKEFNLDQFPMVFDYIEENEKDIMKVLVKISG